MSNLYNLKYLTENVHGRVAAANLEWRIAQFDGTDEEKEEYINNRLEALKTAIDRIRRR